MSSSRFSTGGAAAARAKVGGPAEVVLRLPDAVGKTASECAQRRGRRFSVLGVHVDAVQIDEVIARMGDWIASGAKGRYIAVTGVHGIMEARHDARFRRVLLEANLVVPDGMPLVWIGKLCGHVLRRRVYGPELMLEFCKQSTNSGCRHFFYGGAAGVADQLAESLGRSCPGIHIAGTYGPPFRPLTSVEDAEIVDAINFAAPDVLWVGLSTPKQETWMREHRERLHVPVMVGVGAAFDFLSGRKKQAPSWMREHGFEWLFRVLQEPRRLWRRYLVHGAEFVFLIALELLGLGRFE
jgi:N-acetylglucosaminyldiphosphoundecaprenol N-acetyl-beta-D-mannosaminyltransferase